jgi:hypothetical protein
MASIKWITSRSQRGVFLFIAIALLMLCAIGFGDSSTGWTGGSDFYKSTNGGTS